MAGGDAQLVRWREEPPRPRDLLEGASLSYNGISFVGDKGTLVCGGWSGSPILYPVERRKEFQMPAGTIPRSIGHSPEWIEVCKDHKPEDAKAGFAYSGPFTESLLVGNLPLWLQRRFEWDAANMKASNAVEAGELVHKRYGEGSGIGV